MSDLDRRAHWQGVYRRKDATAVSWYRPHLDTSLQLIEATGVGRDAAVLDVGGGTSTLVDDLLQRGFTAITVLDVCESALTSARQRLADAAAVTWVTGDIVAADLPAAGFDIWHDRAALHFLVDEADRRRYARQLRHALAPGGHAIIATFAPDGPQECSGLPVRRYSVDDVLELLGHEFVVRRALAETHTTPSGNPQRFTYCWLQRET